MCWLDAYLNACILVNLKYRRYWRCRSWIVLFYIKPSVLGAFVRFIISVDTSGTIEFRVFTKWAVIKCTNTSGLIGKRCRFELRSTRRGVIILSPRLLDYLNSTVIRQFGFRRFERIVVIIKYLSGNCIFRLLDGNRRKTYKTTVQDD